jgi:hypothetical protein
MTESETQEVVLTPEQRRRLGQVYRLILSWKRESKNKTEKLSDYELTERKGQFEQINSEPLGSIKSEA